MSFVFDDVANIFVSIVIKSNEFFFLQVVFNLVGNKSVVINAFCILDICLVFIVDCVSNLWINISLSCVKLFC